MLLRNINIINIYNLKQLLIINSTTLFCLILQSNIFIKNLYLFNNDFKLTIGLYFILDLKLFWNSAFSIKSLILFIKWLIKFNKTKRMLLGLPSNGQRTKSNSKTVKKRLYKHFSIFFITFKLKQGLILKKKKNLKKKEKKIIKLKIKNKGPVKRTRDKKKSVWA